MATGFNCAEWTLHIIFHRKSRYVYPIYVEHIYGRIICQTRLNFDTCWHSETTQPKSKTCTCTILKKNTCKGFSIWLHGLGVFTMGVEDVLDRSCEDKIGVSITMVTLRWVDTQNRRMMRRKPSKEGLYVFSYKEIRRLFSSTNNISANQDSLDSIPMIYP